jgi:hypothetical protein
MGNAFMSMEILIVSIIVILTITSIVFGIINWVQFASTSTKISLLESEIEKKSKEFDALKKENRNVRQQMSTEAEIKSDKGLETIQSSFISDPQQTPIEIVRNLRPGFQDRGQLGQTPNGDSLIEIMLFSSIKKDTDFPAAWKNLSAKLPLTPSPRVVLDFKNVMFLYEKELQYLDKIRDIVNKENGTIEFINCHPELQSIIFTHPALAHFIQ